MLAWLGSIQTPFDPDKEPEMPRNRELPSDDARDAFELDDDLESEPEPGDFWEEVDDDCPSFG
jgi:hypothetical protein